MLRAHGRAWYKYPRMLSDAVLSAHDRSSRKSVWKEHDVTSLCIDNKSIHNKEEE